MTIKITISNIEPTLSLGPNKIPLRLFDLNRRRLIQKLQEENQSDGFVLLQGGNDISLYDSDISYVFRQEAYFMWTFGVLEPGFYGVIDVSNGNSYLFAPRLPEAYAVWMGPLLTPEDFKRKYLVTAVHYVDELETVLTKLRPSKLLILKGTNTDSGLEHSGASFEGIKNFKVDNTILFPIIAELRVHKTELELEVMRHAVEISAAAHRRVMQLVRPGLYEFQLESEFLHCIYSLGGCRHVSYTCICGVGENSAVLHYGHAGAPNDGPLQDGDIVLCDMGGSYFGYAADITCTYPVNGKFTDDQKLVYEAVLAANRAVAEAAKPSVSWYDMHILASKTMLEKLKAGGLVKGDVNEMVEAGLGGTFQPHGLGHFMGLDVHDVGGYLPGCPERPQHPEGTKKPHFRLKFTL